MIVNATESVEIFTNVKGGLCGPRFNTIAKKSEKNVFQCSFPKNIWPFLNCNSSHNLEFVRKILNCNSSHNFRIYP